MDKVTVRIATPVKVKVGVLMPGSHEVDAETAEELLAAGVLDTEEGGEETEIKVEVNVADARLSEVEAERDAALDSQAKLEIERDQLLGQVAELQGQVETLQKATAPAGGTVAADAKAPKKGSASPKG